MAYGNEATSSVLREIASICERPCTPGTGKGGHIWRTSAGYLLGTSGECLEDVWMSRGCLEMSGGCLEDVWMMSGGRLGHEMPRGKMDDC